jgi:predicted  nucleic acid-binding Zn-ribbon protein
MSKNGKNVTTEKVTPIGAIEIATSEIESLRDEMTEWAENMESSPLEHTEKCGRVREAADALDNAFNELESAHDDLDRAMEDVGENLSVNDVQYVEFVAYKGRSLSRADRMGNAVTAAYAGIDAYTNALDAREGGSKPTDPDLSAELEEELEKREEKFDAVRDAVEAIRNAIEEAEGVEFPGMYG